ncbi:Protein SCO1 homolog 2, mitochondrial [Linum grandiflorum]
MMPLRQFILFASKYPLRQQHQPLSQLRRFSISRKNQSRTFSKSNKQGHEKRDSHLVSPVEEQPDQSYASFILPGAVLGFAGLAAYVHYNDEKRAIPKGEARTDLSSPGPVIGGPFSLIDTEKRVVTQSDFLGKWVLVYFGYTASPDVGPDQIQTMAKAIDILESQENLKVLPVFVTIDPQRDTPGHLRAYLKGPPSAVRQVAQEYRVFFRKVEEDKDDYLVETSHNLYLIGPNMKVVRTFGLEYNAEHLCEAIVKEMKRKSGSD